jgi:hypothetical protein
MTPSPDNKSDQHYLLNTAKFKLNRGRNFGSFPKWDAHLGFIFGEISAPALRVNSA